MGHLFNLFSESLWLTIIDFGEENKQVDQVFITPPDPELDGDSDGDSGDGEGYAGNLGRSLLQADSIAIISNGRTIGEENAEGNGYTEFSNFYFPKESATVQMDQESCFPRRPHREMVGACTGS